MRSRTLFITSCWADWLLHFAGWWKHPPYQPPSLSDGQPQVLAQFNWAQKLPQASLRRRPSSDIIRCTTTKKHTNTNHIKNWFLPTFVYMQSMVFYFQLLDLNILWLYRWGLFLPVFDDFGCRTPQFLLVVMAFWLVLGKANIPVFACVF